MTRRGYFIRLGISVAIDLFDLTFGRVPIFGSVTEGIGSVVLMLLWGPTGLAYLWEVADFTDQIDSIIPTATIIALFYGWRNGMFGKRSAATDVERAP